MKTHFESVGVCGETSVNGQQSVVTKRFPLLASFSPCPGATPSLNTSSCTTAICRFVKLYILFYTGLLPFVPLKETHLEIPMPSIFYDNNYRFLIIKRDEHILIVSGLLRPTWVLENYQNGVSAWQTTSWWAQPCSIISIVEESTHICGSSTQRRSMQGRYFNKYGIKHRIIQFTGHSVWEQLEWWQTIPHAFRNFLLRKPSDHQSAFSLVIPKTWHCFDLIGASPQKSLMLPSYMCCDFQSNVFQCHPLDVIVIEKL